MNRHTNCKYQVLPLVLLLLLCLQQSTSMWVKKYEENYHRPRYYNRAHHNSEHVDYSRTALEERDQLFNSSSSSNFDPNIQKSYYVHILYKGSVLCSGALISRRMIMTSARCFMYNERDPTYEYKAKHVTVLTGNDIGKLTKTKPAQAIAFYMPASTGNLTAHDVALVALAKKLRRSIYPYIKLYRKVPKVGEEVQLAYLDTVEFEISLHRSTVVDIERCKQYYAQLGLTGIPFDKEFYCVSNKPNTGKEACNTRPGDPLLINNQLAAINMYGEHCHEDEDAETMDVYYPIRDTIKFVQTATDLLRAYTHTGPFNDTVIAAHEQSKNREWLRSIGEDTELDLAAIKGAATGEGTGPVGNSEDDDT